MVESIYSDPHSRMNGVHHKQQERPNSMPFKRRIKNKPSIPLSPWMIVGAAAILLIILVVLAVQNIHREKRYMSRILSEKGAALIKAIEAGARTGIDRKSTRLNSSHYS